MKKYEITVIFDPDVNEEGVTSQLTKLKEMLASFEGQVLNEDNSGRQALAYPMKKKTHGTFVVIQAETKVEFVAEFTRQMRINDAVLRFMVCLRNEAAGQGIVRAEERSARPMGRDSRGGSRDRFSRDSRDKSERSSKSTDSKSSSKSSSKSTTASSKPTDEAKKEAVEAKKPAEAETKKPAEAKSESAAVN